MDSINCNHLNLYKNMQEQIFHKHLAQLSKNRLNLLSGSPPEQKDLVYFQPENAIRFQKFINQQKFMLDLDGDGVLVIPFRENHQVQFKSTQTPKRQNTFAIEENVAEKIFAQSQTTIRKKIPKEIFHCFLMVALLQNSSTSQLFLNSPNEIYMKLRKYQEIIHNPLDLFTIAYRILRGEYSNSDDFQVDIVTMIQNYKIYFIHTPQILTEIIRFEELYWYLNDVELPKYIRLLEEHNKGKRHHRPSEKKHFGKQERIKLHALIKNQKPEVFKKIREYLETVTEGRQVDLHQLSQKDLRHVEEMCEMNEKNVVEQEKYFTTEEIYEALKSKAFNLDDDIYEESDDD